jgi:hypothetical protein
MRRLAAAAAILLAASGTGWAQQSTEDLAKAAQNPIADMASSPGRILRGR